MNEQQIETTVERMIDALDHRFMSGCLSQEQYDLDYKRISEWAKEQTVTA